MSALVEFSAARFRAENPNRPLPRVLTSEEQQEQILRRQAAIRARMIELNIVPMVKYYTSGANPSGHTIIGYLRGGTRVERYWHDGRMIDQHYVGGTVITSSEMLELCWVEVADAMVTAGAAS